jgi:hypothetical protein
MRTIVLMVLAAVTCLFAQADENYNGYRDTARITLFKADSLRYSKVFPLSTWENSRLSIFLNDTSSAGYASDSIKCFWGIQLGMPCINGSGLLDTAWELQLITLDTFDILTAGNMARPYTALDSTGAYMEKMKRIDTLDVTGYAYQTRVFSPGWDVYFRFWAKGLTGNKVGATLKGMFAVEHRNYIAVRAR